MARTRKTRKTKKAASRYRAVVRCYVIFESNVMLATFNSLNPPLIQKTYRGSKRKSSLNTLREYLIAEYKQHDNEDASIGFYYNFLVYGYNRKIVYDKLRIVSEFNKKYVGDETKTESYSMANFQKAIKKVKKAVHGRHDKRLEM